MIHLLKFALGAGISIAALCPAWATNYVVALPADYGGDRKAVEVIISSVFNGVRAGDTLTFVNATELRQLAKIDLPADEANNNLRLRSKLFGPQIAPVGQFIANASRGTAASPPSNINFPQFLREISTTTLPALPGKTADVLLIGSAKYHDPREPRFSMMEGHFPTDGHLRQTDTVTPYGVANRLGTLKGVNVHFCTTDASWVDDLHRQRVHRFWSLYIEQLGGKLATFTGDLTACAQRFLTRVSDGGERYAIDQAQTKAEMLRIRRGASRASEAPLPAQPVPVAFEQGASFMDRGVALATAPPASSTGRAKVGIRWDCQACDLDLYARASAAARFLFWSNQVSPEGRHNKDWRNSPDAEKQHEYIDFLNVIDLNRLELFVHFYEGRSVGGARGVLRIWFEGKVYEQAFLIPAAQGNMQSFERPDLLPPRPEWVRIDARQVMGMRTN